MKERVIWREKNVKIRFVDTGNKQFLIKELHLKRSRETRTLSTLEINEDIIKALNKLI
jgi:hypothetical protein